MTGLHVMSLADAAKLITKTAGEGAVGPTRAALIVVDLVEHWEERGYRSQADGQDGRSWVNSLLGNRMATARAYALAKAIETLASIGFDRDTTCLTKLHHEVLLHLAGETVPNERRKECVNAVLRAQRAAGAGVVFSINQASRVVAETIGKTGAAKARADRIAALVEHIAKLEKIIIKAGMRPPAMPLEKVSQ